MRKRIAIIGASAGQLPLCMKAREMGLETFCFAWPEGAVCKDVADHFFPISIYEKDEIVRICRELDVDGVVSNASEMIAPIAAYIAEKLGKPGTPYSSMVLIQDKARVREITNSIEGLEPIRYAISSTEELMDSFPKPFIMKPVKGAGKLGVNYVDDDFRIDMLPENVRGLQFFAEAFAPGKEYSVESMSSGGIHDVVQITEKIGTGAPHFVELEHHQPALLAPELKQRICKVIPQILTSLGYTTGASHIEIKVDDEGRIYLIEVNPRGGGDYISNELIHRSTDFDYLCQLLKTATGDYRSVEVHDRAFAGVYFLSAFSDRLLPYFDGEMPEWMVCRARDNDELRFSTSNRDRNGHIIYCNNSKVIL